MIALKHAQASEVAETLRSAFAGRVTVDENKQAKQPAASGTQAQARSSDERDKKDSKPAAVKGQAIIDLAPKMTIAVHEASNSLIVTAPQQLFQEVERLANVIDSMAEQTIEVIAPANGAVFESVLMRYLGQEGTSRRPSEPSNRTPDRRESPTKRPDN